MGENTLFLTIADLALGFTGFAGLAGILTMRRVEPRVSLRFWIMIEFGLATIFLSLLPLVLIYLAVAPMNAYRATSGIIALFLGLHLSVFGIKIRALAAEGQWQVGNRLIDQSMPFAIFSTIVIQALCAFGLLIDAMGGLALGLFLLLLLSGLNFVGLLAALNGSADRPFFNRQA